MIFDTHAHYDSGAFNADREQLLASMPSRGVGLILDPGCEERSSRAALALAEKFPFVYAAVGIHPEDMEGLTPESLDTIRALAWHEKCVAIGEIGLDYYWDASHKAEQKELFAAQLALAGELDLPVIVHDREAHADCLEVTGRFPEARGVFHCFSGSAEMAKELVKRGWYLGFDGPVTYKNNKKAPEVLEAVPSDRILIETDSPYMTPVPFRGKRNDSSLVRYVCDRIAEIKGVAPEDMERITLENGKRLFKLA